MILDIILFAAFAAFIGFKLFNSLGKKDYNHDLNNAKETKKSSVIDFNVKKKNDDNAEPVIVKDDYNDLMMRYNTQIAKGLTKISSIEKTFNEKSFINGANYAFEYIFKAFNNGDKQVLQNLIQNDLFKDFESVIEERENSDSIETNTLVSILETHIKDVAIKDNVAQIDVEFVSEQVNLVKDKDGKIIEGNPSDLNKISEIWQFERKLNSNNPNWLLVSTSES